jgi:hypothetical protein
MGAEADDHRLISLRAASPAFLAIMKYSILQLGEQNL